MKRRPKKPVRHSSSACLAHRTKAAGGLHDDELGCGASESHLTAILLAPRILISLQRPVNRSRPPHVGRNDQSQDSAPPDWYSMTRVSKKLRSFFRSIISLIHGNGFSSFGNSASRPICCARRLAM